MSVLIQSSKNLWEILRDKIKRLQSLLSKSSSIQVRSTQELTAAKSVVHFYFETSKPGIQKKSNINTESLDIEMQKLLEHGQKHSLRSSYKKLIKKILKQIGHLETKNLVGSNTTVITEAEYNRFDTKIHATLENLDPTIAASYKQLISDLNSDSRISFRGTVHELREVLRLLLNHMAPDEAVIASPGFKFEPKLTKPTMAQKVNFILKARALPSAQRKLSEQAVKKFEIEDDIFPSLARTIYESGSASAHADFSILRGKVRQLKMFLDAALCEILEIHKD